MTADQGFVTRWVSDLRGGDADTASRKLWERYLDRLVRLARAKLRAEPLASADEEDVALSVFESFLRGVTTGRFAALGGRHDLWRILVTITARNASNRRRDECRQKRGGGRVVGEASLAAVDPGGDEFLPRVLGDDSLRVVALLKLEGYTNEEIAKSLDSGLRTVERKLDVIRKR